jgi:hypothetical protein
MVYDAARQRRDDVTTAEHERLVRETGQQRILSRAKNGELVSYLPEEYGNGRNGIGPKISTAWGYIVFVIIAGAVSVVVTAVVAAPFIDPRPDPPLFVWVIPLMFLGTTALFARYMMIEVRADRLRKQRGLPTPSELSR